MNTVKDLMARVDQQCAWIVHHGMESIRVPAKVVNARINYGNVQYQLMVHGQELWVSESSISWEIEPPIHEDEDTGWPIE